MVLATTNIQEHRTRQTYESYTFQPLMGFWCYQIIINFFLLHTHCSLEYHVDVNNSQFHDMLIKVVCISCILQMKVTGNNLTNICMVVYRVAKTEKNDQLFLEEDILSE